MYCSHLVCKTIPSYLFSVGVELVSHPNGKTQNEAAEENNRKNQESQEIFVLRGFIICTFKSRIQKMWLTPRMRGRRNLQGIDSCRWDN
jgi:hypothetical protein